MPELVPSGYLSIGDALNRLSRELFPSAWSGEEHKARRGLISKDEWNRIKDLPPARGAGPPRSEMLRTRAAFGRADQTPHASSDPSDPLYQAEYEAREYEWARDQLRTSLERGDFEAAALNPFSVAYRYACDVVRELMKGREPTTRCWRLDVYDK
jgi:hypothetical protein